jgi:hypothetical protein
VLAPLWQHIAPDGVIGLGSAGAAVAAVSTVNFALRSPGEQDALTAAYGRWLNSLTGPVQPHHAAPSGLRLTGEVDALAGDPARSRLWVCEVKDVSATASPRTIADRVRKFTDPRRGYIGQLLRSLAEVRASPGAAARLLGLPDPDRAWTVLPVMITRRVEPAAFTTNPAVTFVVCEDLIAVLRAPGDPPPGYAS